MLWLKGTSPSPRESFFHSNNHIPLFPLKNTQDKLYCYLALKTLLLLHGLTRFTQKWYVPMHGLLDLISLYIVS